MIIFWTVLAIAAVIGIWAIVDGLHRVAKDLEEL